MENIKKKEGNILMIIALFIFMGMQPTIISKSISLFMTPMSMVRGVGTTEFSAMIAISGLLAAFLAPVTGKLMEKWGVKVLMLVSAILSIVAFWAISFITPETVGLLYVIGVINGISQLGLSNVVVSTIITSWYPGKNKGTMIGIVMAGSNAFNFMWVNVIGALLAANGDEFYVTLMGILAVIMAVVSIPLILFVFKLNPAMDNTASAKKEDTDAAPVDVPGMTMKEAQKTGVFWLFCLALVSMGIVVTGVQMHTNNFLRMECGADAVVAARIWSLAAPCAVLSNLGMGVLFSKIGEAKTIAIAGVCQVLMAICLILSATTLNFGYGATVLYGLSAGVATTTPAYLTNVMFGQKEYAKIYGFTMMLFLLGATVGSVITSAVSNASSYVTMWKIDFVLIIITFAVFLYTIAKSKSNIEANTQ